MIIALVLQAEGQRGGPTWQAPSLHITSSWGGRVKGVSSGRLGLASLGTVLFFLVERMVGVVWALHIGGVCFVGVWNIERNYS